MQGQVGFRLTASNAQWSAWDEVTFTVMDVNSYHIFRYSADFDGRSATGGRKWANGQWKMGFVVDDLKRYMEGMPANEAASETAVAGNDFFFQDTSQSQTYRAASLNPFDVRFADFGAGGAEPFIGYTTQADWWNYTFGTTKTEFTALPADGVMYVSAFAASGNTHVTAEILYDEVKVAEIGFAGAGWGSWGWRPGTASFLVTKGQHTIRVHLTETGWDFCKFRFDLAVPAIEQIIRFDAKVTIIWSDVGRVYTVQGAQTPKGPWVDVYGPTTETSLTSDIPAGKLGFYRVKVQ